VAGKGSLTSLWLRRTTDLVEGAAHAGRLGSLGSRCPALVLYGRRELEPEVQVAFVCPWRGSRWWTGASCTAPKRVVGSQRSGTAYIPARAGTHKEYFRC
jgi:hypothetical protein